MSFPGQNMQQGDLFARLFGQAGNVAQQGQGLPSLLGGLAVGQALGGGQQDMLSLLLGQFMNQQQGFNNQDEDIIFGDPNANIISRRQQNQQALMPFLQQQDGFR